MDSGEDSFDCEVSVRRPDFVLSCPPVASELAVGCAVIDAGSSAERPSVFAHLRNRRRFSSLLSCMCFGLAIYFGDCGSFGWHILREGIRKHRFLFMVRRNFSERGGSSSITRALFGRVGFDCEGGAGPTLVVRWLAD